MTEPPPPSAGDPDAPTGALRPVAADRYEGFLPVGEGGMGIVYWAMDRDLKRQVAFKVVRPPTDTGRLAVTPPLPFALKGPEGDDTGRGADFEQLKLRFLQEAWVTGGMEHPGVAPVYELGRTEAGVPYYTMKFVRGNRTLKTAINEQAGAPFENRLSLLEAFHRVCDTIRYAHSRGVLHRDLKPDNVALGEFGEVIVLDWGLAKLSGEQGEQQSRWQGQVQEFRAEQGLETLPSAVGTPGYMAPEAARGRTALVDVRSDVYSLGAMLFEILTGRTPFAFTSFRAYLDQVGGGEAPDARDIDPDIPEALAAICRSALAREPGERTPNVEVLTASLRTWQTRREEDREIGRLLAEADAALSSLPDLEGAALLKQVDRATTAAHRVLALRENDAGARARLRTAEEARDRGIAQRERAARRRTLRRAGAVGLVAAALVTGIIAWVFAEKREEAERARLAAASAREEAEGVLGFMVGEMRESLEPLGRLDLLARIGEEARTYYQDLPAEARTPESLRNGALALRTLGDVHFEQGDLPAAKEAYRASGEMAETLLVSMGKESDTEAAYLLSQARAEEGAVLIAQGYPTQAVAWLEAHLEEVQERLRAQPAERHLQAAEGEAHHLLSRALARRFDVEPALSHAALALSSAEARAKQDDDKGGAARDVVRYLLAPVRLLLVRGRLEEVEARVERAAAHVSSGLERDPSDARWRWLRAQQLVKRAQLHEARAQPAPARDLYATALDSIEVLRGLDPQNATYQALESKALHRRGFVLRELALRSGTPAGDVRAHHDSWRKAHAIRGQLVARDPSNALWLHAMIGLCDRMAQVEEETTRNGGHAERFREQALDWARKLVACDEENVLWLHLLAYTLHKHAVRRRALEPERSHGHNLEVTRICRALESRYPDGLSEVAVLHAWAVQAFSQDALSAAEHLSHLGAAVDMLVHAHGADTGRLDVLLVLIESRVQLGAVLAQGDAKEHARARAQLDSGRALLVKARVLAGEDPAHLAGLARARLRLDELASRLEGR